MVHCHCCKSEITKGKSSHHAHCGNCFVTEQHGSSFVTIYPFHSEIINRMYKFSLHVKLKVAEWKRQREKQKEIE